MGAYYTGPQWATAALLVGLVASSLAFVRWAREQSREHDRIRRRHELTRAARAVDPLRAYLDRSVAEATNLDGSPLFHPPGKHPATARLRLQLERLEEFGWGDSDIAAHIREQLVAFEEGESVAKHRYYAARRS